MDLVILGETERMEIGEWYKYQ